MQTPLRFVPLFLSVCSSLACAQNTPTPVDSIAAASSQTAVAPTELLLNGDFSRGQAGWQIPEEERLHTELLPAEGLPAEAPFTKMLRLHTFPKPGQNPWDVRLETLVPAPIAPGTKISLKVWMRSSQPVILGAFANENDNRDNKFVSLTPSLSSGWKLYEASGIANKPFGPNEAFVEFHVGVGPATIDVAGVQLLATDIPLPVPKRDYAKLVFPKVVVGPGSQSDLIDTTKITGAKINETSIQRTLTAQPGTLRTTLNQAVKNLAAGFATRVLLAPGIYRDSITDIDWKAGLARNTLLVLEAQKPGTVTWSGADVFPLSEWKNEGNGLYSHAWTGNFGLYADPWGPPKTIGHRREMLFLNGQALKQIELELYQNSRADLWGNETWGSDKPSYVSTGTRPATELRPGEFGVTERPENGGKIFFRVPVGAVLHPASIEVSTRQTLLDMTGKNNLVIRGLTFARVAGSLHDVSSQAGLGWRETYKNENRSDNVLIDGCNFVWNNMTGLSIAGRNWTIRHCHFDWNGGSGIAGDGGSNILFESNTTNFNNWRIWLGGERGWSFGGVKMAQTAGLKVLRHEAIGNLTVGFWCDIHCKNVFMQDAVLANNSCNLMWELSQGPFHGRRIVSVNNLVINQGANVRLWNNGRTKLENSILWSRFPLNKSGDVLNVFSNPRNDPHAQMEPVIHQGFELRGCLIGSHSTGPFLVNQADRRNPFAPNFVPFFFKNANNVYWPSQAVPPSVAYLDDQLRERHLSLGEWFQTPRHSEIGSHSFDPQLRDPANFDLRFAPSSPLAARAKEYPQWRMSDQRRQQMYDFFAWVG